MKSVLNKSMNQELIGLLELMTNADVEVNNFVELCKYIRGC